MAEQLLPYALTTLARVKDRIFDTNVNATQPSSFDTVLKRMINSATDWFEQACNGRRFVQTLYTNEIYSPGPKQKRLITKQAPIVVVNFTGDTTVGSPTISSVSRTSAMVVGMPVQGPGIPASTVISSIGVNSVTLSRNATAASTTEYFQANGLINFEYRAGTPSAPSWTPFIPDQYELINDGKAGIIRLYGILPSITSNQVRLKYSAGYPVNWPTAGDNDLHQLPSSISDTVENMVVRRFKRRMLAGKASEGLEGATTSWNRDIDKEDEDVINQWRRPIIF